MAIKKKSKVSPNFNMSSLTDIIFLLLIFFMLTSSAIVPNALNLQLPGKNTSVSPRNSKPTVVSISSAGNISLNGSRVTIASLERQLASLKRAKGKQATVTIAPNAKASNDVVVAVMDIAYRYEIKAALTDPK